MQLRGLYDLSSQDEKRSSVACPAALPVKAMTGCLAPALTCAVTDEYVNRSYLVDTGCPFDLVARSDLQKCDVIRQAEEDISLATANGLIKVGEVVDMQVGPLGEVTTPYVLEDTPLVLNVGNRCIYQGYGFHWPPWSRLPYYEMPYTGEKVFLREDNGCAYLDDNDLICMTTSPPSVACSGIPNENYGEQNQRGKHGSHVSTMWAGRAGLTKRRFIGSRPKA